MTNKEKRINIGEHTCFKTPQHMIVPLIGKIDQERELRQISQEYYQEHLQKEYPWLPPLLGEWRLCKHRQRRLHAFYVKPDRIREGKGWYCSLWCRLEDFRFRSLRPEKLVVDINPRSSVYSKIGKVVGINDHEVRVDFNEGEDLIRVYRLGRNLLHIVIYDGKKRSKLRNHHPLISQKAPT